MDIYYEQDEIYTLHKKEVIMDCFHFCLTDEA